MENRNLVEALEKAVIAHCAEAGIAEAAVQVFTADSFHKPGYIICVFPGARRCFETLFIRVFGRPPAMVESGYFMEEQDAFAFTRLEPYYSAPANWQKHSSVG